MEWDASPTDRFGRREELVTYEVGDDEHLEDAILAAFDALGFDLYEMDPPLVEFVDTDALEQLDWGNPDLRVTTRVWGYPVRVTGDEVTVYAADDRNRSRRQ